MAQILDLRKEYRHFYNPSSRAPEIVEVPTFDFLMIDGHGDPNLSAEYQQAVEALYSLAYTIKFEVKRSHGIDFTVMALEGLWWAEDMTQFSTQRKQDWDWTMMIMQPDLVSAELVASCQAQALKKKKKPAIEKIRFERYEEGTAVQLLHIGPYAEEGPNIARMHAFAQEQGYALHGKHHEIYLGDPRRSAPEKLKTVLRQPLRRSE